MKMQHELPQAEEIRDHIAQHRERYLFGAGLVLGVLGTRLLGRPPVVIINNVLQGGTPSV